MPTHGTDSIEPKPRRVLVTGGAGFIGSHLVEHLLGEGASVTVVDDLSTGRRENLPGRHEGLRFIEADLAHELDAFGPGEMFEEVYHLAAAVGVQLVIDDPIRAIEINVEQTAALLRFAATHGGESGGAPTLIASSSEVYGKGTRCPFREDDDVVYGPSTVARWSYAQAKAVDEHLALAHAHAGSVPTVVARFFNTIGPRQVGSYGMVVPRFVAAALLGEALIVHGDGTQTRCFADVRDIAPTLPRLLRSRECRARVFNVGSDREVSIRELADLVIRTLGSGSGVTTIPYSEAFASGFEDLQRRVPDLTRICETIGFEASISLEQSILDVAACINDRGGP